MRNAGLGKAQAGIKIARRNINNLIYADDTTLMEEELKRSRGSPILLGTHREPGRAGAKPGGAGRGGVPFAVGVGSWRG